MSEEMHKKLNKELFSDSATNVYAVLDGASVPVLRDKFYEEEPEHACLYAGDLEPDMEEVAPYLVRLEQGSRFTDWLISNGWGNHWGIFASASEDLRTVRKHFRTFLLVQDPEGKTLYFRYYDPRVMRVYLPTCNEEESRAVFGPIQWYVMEGEEEGELIRIRPDEEGMRQESVQLAAVIT